MGCVDISLRRSARGPGRTGRRRRDARARCSSALAASVTQDARLRAHRRAPGARRYPVESCGGRRGGGPPRIDVSSVATSSVGGTRGWAASGRVCARIHLILLHVESQRTAGGSCTASQPLGVACDVTPSGRMPGSPCSAVTCHAGRNGGGRSPGPSRRWPRTHAARTMSGCARNSSRLARSSVSSSVTPGIGAT